MRLREYINAVGAPSQEQIAKKVGVSPAYISTVWKTGVGGRSIDGFAKLFKLENAETLRKVAYEWYLNQSPRALERVNEPAVAAAVEQARGLHPHITDEQFRAILHRFSDEAFDDRDADFWFETLLTEIKHDYLRAQRKAVEQKSRARAVRHESSGTHGAVKTKQAQFRTGHTLKKAVEEEQAVAELEAPVEAPAEIERQQPKARPR